MFPRTAMPTCCARMDARDAGLHDVTDVEDFVAQIHLAGLEPGHVQDVRDQLEQMLSRGADVGHVPSAWR